MTFTFRCSENRVLQAGAAHCTDELSLLARYLRLKTSEIRRVDAGSSVLLRGYATDCVADIRGRGALLSCDGKTRQRSQQHNLASTRAHSSRTQRTANQAGFKRVALSGGQLIPLKRA